MINFFNILASIQNRGNTPISVGDYSTESQEVFLNFTGGNALSNAEKDAISYFIDNQVRFGNWSKIKEIQMLSGLSSSSKSLIGFKGNNATNVGCSFTPATGFTTDGVSTYIDTNIVPSIIQTSETNVGYQGYCINNRGNYVFGCIGASTANQVFLSALDNGTFTYRGNSSSTGTATSPVKENSLFGVNVESGKVRGNWNSQAISQYTKSSGVAPETSIYIGARNYNGYNSGGNSDVGCFIVHDYTEFNFSAFYVYLDILLMELGVRSMSSLFNKTTKEYSSSDALLFNSEGQSNSKFAGNGQNPTVPSLSNPIVGANMFWRPNWTTPLEIQTLEYLSNHTYDTSPPSSKTAAGLAISKDLVDTQNLNLYISAYGKSGTSMADWSPTTNTLIYDSHERILKPGIDLVTEPIKKIWWDWGQGEADANGRTQEEYTADFYTLLAYKIDAYESKGIDLTIINFYVTVPKIYINLGGVRATKDDIIAAQSNFSVINFENTYPMYAGKVNSITVYDNDDIFHSDNIHMNAQGYEIEGYRVSNFIKGL